MPATTERTDPKLWDKVKRQITKGDKGGEPGQWSARKAQLATQAYKKAGGTYKGSKPADNKLAQWTKEDWGTRSGKDSSKTGERYLPKKARENLTEGEHKRTTAKKRADKAASKQFSAQPKDVAAKTARYRAPTHGTTRADLIRAAAAKGIAGRSKMTKAELAGALAHADKVRS